MDVKFLMVILAIKNDGFRSCLYVPIIVSIKELKADVPIRNYPGIVRFISWREGSLTLQVMALQG